MKGASAAVIAILMIFALSAPVLLSDDSSAEPVTITYDWNGGVGKITSSEATAGVEFSLPGTSDIKTPKPADADHNYAFIGWNESPSGTTGFMLYSPSADVTLYAVWAPSFDIVGYMEKEGTPFGEGDISVKVLFGTTPGSPLFTYTFEDIRVDDEGRFSVTVPAKLATPSGYEPLSGGNYYLKVHSPASDDIIGYGIGSISDKMTKTTISNIFEIDVSGATWTEETGYEYMVTGINGSLNCITLYTDDNAVGSIRGKIIGDKTYELSGATIEVVRLDGKTVVAKTTSSFSNYEISSCPAGSYTVRVTALDYEPEETGTIFVKTGETLVLDFYLTPKPTQTYLGFDLPHFMMIVGAFVAAILFLSALIVRRIARRNPSLLKEEEE
ncbi:MAG: carboxypeptidase regulatory-like domain-containing protein [Candidatus Methanomethylophilaceae archaeon]|jgi:hypothetical protein|nr:carboxypeptidase regulatory-like domain-containing protein [Candidatus Methanomethylophilaceae archaeon]